MSRTSLSRAARAAVLLAASLVPACGLRQQPNLTAEQQHLAQVRELQRVSQVTERVGVLVASLQQVEIGLHRVGRVPDDLHTAIQTYLKLSADFVVSSLEQAKDQTKSPQTRRDGILAALKLIDGFQTQIVDKIPDESARTQLGMIVLSIQTILLTWQLVAELGGEVIVDVVGIDAIVQLCADVESPHFLIEPNGRFVAHGSPYMWLSVGCRSGDSKYETGEGVIAMPLALATE